MKMNEKFLMPLGRVADLHQGLNPTRYRASGNGVFDVVDVVYGSDLGGGLYARPAKHEIAVLPDRIPSDRLLRAGDILLVTRGSWLEVNAAVIPHCPHKSRSRLWPTRICW